jgi:S1-C subfamily serine protease
MGVVLEDGATIATCAHVVENHTWVKVTMGSFVDDGYVVAVNKEDDIAIVRTEYKMQPFSLDTCMHTLIKGDFAVAAGRKPVSGRPDMRFGSVMGYMGGYSSDMHISANIERGFSGGPVMDRDGYLIGISQGLVGSYTAGIGSRIIPTWKIVSLIRNSRLEFSKNYSRPSVAPMELTALVPTLPELDEWMAKFNSN